MLKDPKLKQYLEYLTLGSEIAFSLSAPILFGYWLDSRYSTMPRFTIAGVFLGLILLIVMMIRLVRKFTNKTNNQE